MSERPIIFSGPMVRAIREGRKTQTRRIVKSQPGPIVDHAYHRPDGWYIWCHLPAPAGVGVSEPFCCPHGAVGDRLWVRETFTLCHGNPLYAANDDTGDLPLCPSIYMPRWASRITLEIVNVRVERLQNISKEDAIAEGLTKAVHDHGTYWGIQWPDVWEKDPSRTYERLWDSLNAKRAPWATNPWVWVIEFKRCGDE